MTDNVVLRIAGKELRLLFTSYVAWLFLAIFAVVSLFTFFWVEAFFARNTADLRPLFKWMPLLLLFLCPALTMRMWSEERASGTLEHVLTQPVPLWQFTAGKFLACLALLLVALGATAALPFTVALIADPDPGPIISGYVAAVLLGASYLAAGLFASARSNNAMISFATGVILCALLYLPGSALVTGFVDDRSAELLRRLGTGSRFADALRGIIDVRHIIYYLSLTAMFLVLASYRLERDRWSNKRRSGAQSQWRLIVLLTALNLLALNLWLAPLDKARLDITAGSRHTLSQPTIGLLEELQEPLLLRGYFSARTHPLLSPLVPQVRELLQDYATAANGRVKVEFVDPATAPAMEDEANRRYGIKPTPFQIADRHQSAVVNAYFNVLVSYGTSHRVLGFSDLIEVRTAANGRAEVMLRNPEYDISHAIKGALLDYQMGGNLFSAITTPVELIGYVSADSRLPDQLRNYRKSIEAQLANTIAQSDGMFSARFIEPEARNGEVARQIEKSWGLRPMLARDGSGAPFYFHLTLADGEQVVQLPLGSFDATEFRLALDTGLRRFAKGLTHSVALALPKQNAGAEQYGLGGPAFANLERAIGESYSIIREDLSDGAVSPGADALAIIAPLQYDEAAVFAIDQFLMRGGTVVIATSGFSARSAGGELSLVDWSSGLGQWLTHHGISLHDALVADEQSAVFPTPVKRRSGEYEFNDVKLMEYPFFIDVRPDSMDAGSVITANLPQVTMAWSTPIFLEPDNRRRSRVLLRSSAQSWLTRDREIMPGLSDAQNTGGAGDVVVYSGPFTLGLEVQGVFDSMFDATGGASAAVERPATLQRGSFVARSPESARLVVFSSNDFLSDQALTSQVTATGTQYLGPIELFVNTLDYALQDEQLMTIRSRGHFNRTLPPMERQAQMLLEYMNYGLALLWLLALGILSALLARLQRRSYRRRLQL